MTSARNVSVRIVAGTAAALFFAGISLAPSGASAPGASAGARAQKGAHNSSPSPLIDHGGKILTASKTYAIWWGNPTAFPSDAASGIATLLDGFGGSDYLAIANEYMRGATAASTYEGSLSDTTTAPPSHAPSVSTIVNEVARLITTPDPNAIYFVYTSNFPNANYCAWHASGTINGVTVQVAYLPNTSGVAGCDPGNLYNANSLSQGTRSLADSTAHEFMEATTDPVPVSAWADQQGQEIGDKCNFVYSAPVKLSNKSVWQLQEEWSNASNGCVQGSGV